jgi:hypothetical protein
MPPGLQLDASTMHQAGGLEAWDDEGWDEDWKKFPRARA